MARSYRLQFNEYGMRRLAETARNAMAILVLAACVVSLSIILYNQYGARFSAALANSMALFNLIPSVPPAEVIPAAVNPGLGKYRAMGEYLARRYKVSSEVTTNIVAKAHAVGAEFNLDPLLILAVISIESRFNPIAESARGAKGLMQVIPRYHLDKFEPLGGDKMIFEPEANILVGARILQEYMRRTGDLDDALQMYVGAPAENNNGYSARVMAERDRLKQVLSDYQHRPNRL